MGKVLAKLGFATIQILFLPFTVLGLVVYVGRSYFYSKRQKTSLTAYKPIESRYLFHQLGARFDPLAAKLFVNLPAMSPLIAKLSYGALILGSRLSGYQPSFLRYPGENNGLGAILGLRTAFFDQAISAAAPKISQLVLLGAGWVTRSLAYAAAHPSLRVFEVDTPAMQKVKLHALNKARLDYHLVTFVAVDFEEQSWLEQLSGQGFDSSKPTFILWEGVVYYLRTKTVSKMLAQISTNFTEASFVGFDYPSRELVKGYHQFGLVAKLLLLVLKLGHESWRFGISTRFNPADQAAHYLQCHNLELVVYQQWGNAISDSLVYGGVVIARPRSEKYVAGNRS